MSAPSSIARDDVSRVELARAILDDVRLGAVKKALDDKKDWRGIVFRGFRAQSLTRPVLLREARNFSLHPDLLQDLVHLYLDQHGIVGDHLADRMTGAHQDEGIPSYIRELLFRASTYSRISDIPIEQTVVRSDAPDSVTAELLEELDEDSPSSSTAETSDTSSSKVWTKQPFQWKPPDDDAATVGASVILFERLLSAFVQERLSFLHGSNWLRKGCPEQLLEKLEEQQRRNTAVAPTTLLGYADLGDLFLLVRTTKNWPVFEPYFQSKPWLESKVAQIIPLRIGPAHAGQRRLYRAVESAGFGAMVEVAGRFNEEIADLIDLYWQQGSLESASGTASGTTRAGSRIAVNFVQLPRPRILGRDSELGDIHRFWADEFKKIMTITGRGGVGKTALAFEFVHRLLERPLSGMEKPHPEAILFFSAKRSWAPGDLQDRLPEAQSFLALRTVLEAFLSLCGYSTPHDFNDDQLRLTSLRELRDVPTLLVLDNLEGLDAEEIDEIGRFLQQIPGSSKALVTDRIHRGLGERLPLEGIPTKAAVELLTNETERRGGRILPKQARGLERLANSVQGVPLYLHFLVNSLVNGYSPSEAISQLRGRDTLELLRFSFESSIASLPPVGREVLYYLAMCLNPPTRRELVKIVPKNDELDSALTSLRNAHFIENVPLGDSIGFSLTDDQLREFVKLDLVHRLDPARVSVINFQSGSDVSRARDPNIAAAIRQAISEAEEAARASWEGGVAAIELAINNFGRVPMLLAKLGYFENRLRKPRRARALLEEALAGGFEDAELHDTLAWLDVGTGQFSSAVSHAEAVLSTIPDDPKGLLVLGYALLGQARRSGFMLDAGRRNEMIGRSIQALTRAHIDRDVARWQRDHNDRCAGLLAQATELLESLKEL